MNLLKLVTELIEAFREEDLWKSRRHMVEIDRASSSMPILLGMPSPPVYNGFTEVEIDEGFRKAQSRREDIEKQISAYICFKTLGYEEVKLEIKPKPRPKGWFTLSKGKTK